MLTAAPGTLTLKRQQSSEQLQLNGTPQQEKAKGAVISPQQPTTAKFEATGVASVNNSPVKAPVKETTSPFHPVSPVKQGSMKRKNTGVSRQKSGISRQKSGIAGNEDDNEENSEESEEEQDEDSDDGTTNRQQSYVSKPTGLNQQNKRAYGGGALGLVSDDEEESQNITRSHTYMGI